MTIKTLRITDFRNLASVELEPLSVGINIIYGNNGSGKTSLVEVIHYLSLGKSFRSSSALRLIRQETEKFSLFAQITNTSLPSFRVLSAESSVAVSNERPLTTLDSAVKPRNDGGGTRNNGTSVSIGLERHISGTSRLRMNEQDVSSIANIAALLPVQLIHSQSHFLLEAGPIYRRKYLDWGLFYHSERFLPCWRQFERVLKQRNTILKEKRSKQELDGWSDELIRLGNEFNQLRRDYIAQLEPVLAELAQELLPIHNLELIYDAGWDESIDYSDAIAQSYLDDYRYGYTQQGPHRADFEMYADGIPVKHFLSRGQQKLLICAMIIAQGQLLAGQVNRGLIYLVDDLPSELDWLSRQKLISLLARQPTQIFITAIDHNDICNAIDENITIPMKVFHVEHGNVSENNELIRSKNK